MVQLIFFYTDGFDIDLTTKINIPLNKEIKPNELNELNNDGAKVWFG